MIAKVKDVVFGKAAFALSVLWITALAIVHMWPASWWMDVQSVRVADAKAGDPILMHVEREIHRSFSGTWGVSVRVMGAGKGYVICSESAVSGYLQGADLPDTLTLSWWTNGQCNTLPVGAYIVQTEWQVHGNGILPVKTITATSNLFKVYE